MTKLEFKNYKRSSLFFTVNPFTEFWSAYFTKVPSFCDHIIHKICACVLFPLGSRGGQSNLLKWVTRRTYPDHKEDVRQMIELFVSKDILQTKKTRYSDIFEIRKCELFRQNLPFHDGKFLLWIYETPRYTMCEN